jgi:hypothetical protein
MINTILLVAFNLYLLRHTHKEDQKKLMKNQKEKNTAMIKTSSTIMIEWSNT